MKCNKLDLSDLLELWDGFGGLKIFNRKYFNDYLYITEQDKDYVYRDILDIYGDLEVRSFGVSVKAKGVLEIFLK